MTTIVPIKLFDLIEDKTCCLVTVPESAVIASFYISGTTLYATLFVDDDVLENKGGLLKTWHFHLVEDFEKVDLATDSFIVTIRLSDSVISIVTRKYAKYREIVHLFATTKVHEKTLEEEGSPAAEDSQMLPERTKTFLEDLKWNGDDIV